MMKGSLMTNSIQSVVHDSHTTISSKEAFFLGISNFNINFSHAVVYLLTSRGIEVIYQKLQSSNTMYD